MPNTQLPALQNGAITARAAEQLYTQQFSVTTTAIPVALANPTRQRVTILNTGLVNLYLGPGTIPEPAGPMPFNPLVTSTTGVLLAPGAARVFTSKGAIYAITASGTGSVDVQDEFD